VKASAAEVASKLEEIAGHLRVTGRLDSLKCTEIAQMLGMPEGKPSTAKLEDYFSPEEIENISKLPAEERLKIGNRLESVKKTASQRQDAGDKAA